MPLSPGQVLNNRYRIVRLLGQGGFGAVYRAWDLTFELACAVKENSQTSDDGQRQFLREARLLHTLRHPNLPLVKDYFVLPDPQGGTGSAFLVMDFVDGEDLEQLLRRRSGPLDEAEVLPWIGQVCDALSYLHAQNPAVIHRDIKPANIRITPDGRAMLVDFGISKVYDLSAQTTVGARAVTPGFSPLEQYGLGGRTDARSDVYALGATLYALLTGQVPSEATARSPDRPLTPPRRLNPKVTPQIEAALVRALELFAAGRYPSAAAFKAALDEKTAPAPLEPLQVQHAAPRPPTTAPLALDDTLIVPPPTSPETGGSLVAPAANNQRLYWIAGAAAVALLLLLSIPWLIDSLGLPAATPAVETVPVVTEDINANLQLTYAAETLAARPPEGMALIPAGTFMMGSESGDSDEKPVHEVYLDAFYIDTYEVTNAEFAEFLNARGNQEEGGVTWLDAGGEDARIHEQGGEWQADDGFADHPVIEVSWYGARAYCAWRGRRLPTEAEWEKAARGGLEGMKFPWGDESPVCELEASNGAQYSPCDGETVPVGGFAPNGYGLFDMPGNVWEWVSSIYQTYPYDAGDGREDPQAGGSRVVRGGAWYYYENFLRVANRNRTDPSSSYDNFGFRCAHSVEAAPSAAATRAGGTEAALAATSAAATEAARPPEGMALIPADAFQMGSESGYDHEKPVHAVDLDAFFIDIYEVTNAQFTEFLNALGNQEEGGANWFRTGEDWVHIQESGGQWQANSDYAVHPVIGVTWYGARAYCEWRGGRLPTEAEWEKAARGGLEGRQYPWGNNSPSCERKAQNGAQYNVCGGQTRSVGSFASNGYGLFDMAGNVWEWVSSLYQSYPYDALDGREDPQAGGSRVVRGGAWAYDEHRVRVANRRWYDPYFTGNYFGFRCARSP